MKELVILSGKGGTGKTSLTAAFAAISKNKVLCDADVDAADLHLLTAPQVRRRTDFKGGGVAIIDPAVCSECGTCMDLCRFDAIKDDFTIDDIDCEGCGVCVDFCPEQAVSFPVKVCGEWYVSDTRFGPMVHAKLGIAEENSGKLVTLVRQEAKKLAEDRQLDLLITDGPPGIGCPVIASIGGAAAVLVVTEPTVSGIHDMERVVELAGHFHVPVAVCVNKYDLNPQKTVLIEQYVQQHKLTFAGNIPFDPLFTESMVNGKTSVEYKREAKVNRAVEQVWEVMMSLPVMNDKI